MNGFAALDFTAVLCYIANMAAADKSATATKNFILFFTTFLGLHKIWDRAEMNDEAQKHPEVVYGMMFNQRTNCIYRKMRELVQSGIYGQIRRTNWLITTWYRPQAYYDSGDWRATWSGEGGGVLLN